MASSEGQSDYLHAELLKLTLLGVCTNHLGTCLNTGSDSVGLGEARDPSLLTSPQMMLLLLVQQPCLENGCSKAYSCFRAKQKGHLLHTMEGTKSAP